MKFRCYFLVKNVQINMVEERIPQSIEEVVACCNWQGRPWDVGCELLRRASSLVILFTSCKSLDNLPLVSISSSIK